METPLEPVANVLVTGAPTRFAGVRFQSIGKVYHFDASAQADLRVGDYVIVHVGFAISKLDEEAARRTLETYAELAASGSPDATDGRGNRESLLGEAAHRMSDAKQSGG
jgi:hydrogenase expression/formation protein HypC